MRKITTLVIAAVFLLCIVLVSFFGMKYTSYEPITHVQHIGILSDVNDIGTRNYRPDNEDFPREPGTDTIRLSKTIHFSGKYPGMGDPIIIYYLEWRVYPDLISLRGDSVNLSVPGIDMTDGVIETDSYKITRAGNSTAEIRFKQLESFTITLTAQDGSDKKIRLQFMLR